MCYHVKDCAWNKLLKTLNYIVNGMIKLLYIIWDTFYRQHAVHVDMIKRIKPT